MCSEFFLFFMKIFYVKMSLLNCAYLNYRETKFKILKDFIKDLVFSLREQYLVKSSKSSSSHFGIRSLRNRSADYARNSMGMKFTRRYEIRIEFHRQTYGSVKFHFRVRFDTASYCREDF